MRVLRYVLDEAEFLSPFGIRSLSRVYAEHPYVLHVDGQEHRIGYVPGESDTGLYGGNSNWRGPVWFPVNLLLVEALERYHHLPSVRGDLLRKLGRDDEARTELLRAAALTENARERALLLERALPRGVRRTPGRTLTEEAFGVPSGTEMPTMDDPLSTHAHAAPDPAHATAAGERGHGSA